ncbi:ophiophagus venom factor-like [Dreissena polymorpha]|uniref:ophiophagus venom factor-like n=1 Tax=Dreissena polymorpha TaxID=45954 RepID=UPI0022646061|nr:ophiophagus venom factor-like [Dreissena polymorpha]
MQSDPQNDPSLTSFVLISFQECKIWNEEITNSSRRAMAYLEQLSEKALRENPFLLAITAYALALANSDKMDFFRDLLYDTRSEESDLLFWSNRGDAPNGYGVETTAYALLTFLEVKEYRICTKIAAWLSKQDTLIKDFGQNTMQNAIPLQALAKYTERMYRMNEILEVRIENGPLVWSGLLSSINDHVAEIDLPLTNKSNRFQVTTTGFGSGTLTIEMSYNTKPEDDTINVLNSYNISNIIIKDSLILNNQNESKCDVCGYCEEPSQNEDRLDGEKRPDIQISARLKCVQFAVKTTSGHNYTGLSVVKTYLPVGVNIVPSDIQKMFNEGVFVRYEMPNDGKGFVQFYMDKISTDPSVFIFRIEDTFSDDFSSRFVLSVLVYDYYNPERSSMKHYMIGSGNGQASPVVCDDGGGQCKCNRVVSSDSEEIFQEPTPADALYDHKHDGECHVTGCYCHSVTGDQTCCTLLKKKPTSKDGE